MKQKFPKKKYRVIYADPAWPYKNFSHPKARRGAAKEYKLMQMQDIADLPVAEISAKDAVLFLWTTGPMMKEAERIMEWWGFEYKTWAFVWVKKNKIADSLFTGNGWWTRSNAEICLLGVRGNPKRVSASVHQVIISKRGRHSEKPDEARKRIVQLMGNVPRIELFARGRPAPGWDAWGDEVTR